MVSTRVNGQFSLSSCLKLLASQMGREDKVSHVMRNEMRLWLEWLHRLVQFSCLFLAREQK
jgi:hypothetical protein